MPLVTLAACPPGLFLFDRMLGFKTEYGAMSGKTEGREVVWSITNRSDAYCVGSGEYFIGGADSPEAREDLMVLPIDLCLSAVRRALSLRLTEGQVETIAWFSSWFEAWCDTPEAHDVEGLLAVKDLLHQVQVEAPAAMIPQERAANTILQWAIDNDLPLDARQIIELAQQLGAPVAATTPTVPQEETQQQVERRVIDRLRVEMKDLLRITRSGTVFSLTQAGGFSLLYLRGLEQGDPYDPVAGWTVIQGLLDFGERVIEQGKLKTSMGLREAGQLAYAYGRAYGPDGKSDVNSFYS